ncbi:MAG: hypothetical protein V4587_19250 [Acidobacteriota bacterium]
MEYSKLRTKAGLIAAFCVLGLGTTLMAQTTASSSSTAVPNAPAPSTTINPSRADIFLGFSYYAPNSYVNGAKYAAVNLGAIGSGKTRIMSSIIQRLKQRTCVIVSSLDIQDACIEEFRLSLGITPGAKGGGEDFEGEEVTVCQAQHFRTWDAQKWAAFCQGYGL